MNGPGDLALYGNISMFLMIGLLVGLIVFALIERGDATVDDEHLSQLRAALADQRARRVVLGTPTSKRPAVTSTALPARGAGVTFDVARPGRHRARARAGRRWAGLATPLPNRLTPNPPSRLSRSRHAGREQTVLTRRKEMKRTTASGYGKVLALPPVPRARLTERSGGVCEAQLAVCTGQATDACHRISRKAGGRPNAYRDLGWVLLDDDGGVRSFGDAA